MFCSITHEQNKQVFDLFCWRQRLIAHQDGIIRLFTTSEKQNNKERHGSTSCPHVYTTLIISRNDHHRHSFTKCTIVLTTAITAKAEIQKSTSENVSGREQRRASLSPPKVWRNVQFFLVSAGTLRPWASFYRRAPKNMATFSEDNGLDSDFERLTSLSPPAFHKIKKHLEETTKQLSSMTSTTWFSVSVPHNSVHN